MHKLPGPNEHTRVVPPSEMSRPKRSKRVIVEKEKNYQHFLRNPQRFTIPEDFG